MDMEERVNFGKRLAEAKDRLVIAQHELDEVRKQVQDEKDSAHIIKGESLKNKELAEQAKREADTHRNIVKELVIEKTNLEDSLQELRLTHLLSVEKYNEMIANQVLTLKAHDQAIESAKRREQNAAIYASAAEEKAKEYERSKAEIERLEIIKRDAHENLTTREAIILKKEEMILVRERELAEKHASLLNREGRLVMYQQQTEKAIKSLNPLSHAK